MASRSPTSQRESYPSQYPANRLQWQSLVYSLVRLLYASLHHDSIPVRCTYHVIRQPLRCPCAPPFRYKSEKEVLLRAGIRLRVENVIHNAGLTVRALHQLQ
jgi:hypothetical protein